MNLLERYAHVRLARHLTLRGHAPGTVRSAWLEDIKPYKPEDFKTVEVNDTTVEQDDDGGPIRIHIDITIR
jgi:hypothetical protein